MGPISVEEYLKGKKILAVDDEDDVLDIIMEQLPTCDFCAAGDFETAKYLLENCRFDLVILDIMGVRGFDLLDITRDRQMPAIMLTAHALTPDGFQRSIEEGAVSYLSKDEISHLGPCICEILQELEAGRTHWPKLIQRLGPKFKQIWGSMWDKIRLPKDDKLNWK